MTLEERTEIATKSNTMRGQKPYMYQSMNGRMRLSWSRSPGLPGQESTDIYDIHISAEHEIRLLQIQSSIQGNTATVYCYCITEQPHLWRIQCQ